jgi:hypothetical protein
MNEEQGPLGAGFKQMVTVLAVVFGVTLAVVIGKKMSTEAMAVVIGVVCGVAAGIPISGLLLVALTRRDRQREELERGAQLRAGAYPPVVVIQGGAPQSLGAGSQAGYWPAPPSGPPLQRQFYVVGDDDLLPDDGHYARR